MIYLNTSGADSISKMPELKNIKSWTERLRHSRPRSFTDDECRFWLEQNSAKASKWASSRGKVTRWLGNLTELAGLIPERMRIDSEIYTPSEATKKFLKANK
jgi:hypothetical protein